MAAGLVGLYGVYLLLVGVHGNTDKLLTLVEDNGEGFIVWILAIAVLSALYHVKTIQPAIKPLIALVVLVFVLKNYSSIASQLNIYLPKSAQIPNSESK